MTRHDAPDEARRRFFDAAVRLCATKGFAATRMEDIAAEAGRSKGALYHHFSTKKELLVELMHDLVDRFSGDIDAGMLDGGSARDLMLGSIAGMMQAYEAMDILRVFVEVLPLAARDAELRVPLLRYYEQAIASVAGLLAWGQQRGELRDDFDPRRTARVLTYGGDGILMMATVLGETATAAEQMGELFTRVFDGLEPR